MNKNFITMVGNVSGEVQDTSTEFQTIVKRIINRKYFQVLRAINWQNIDYSYSFSTVAGTQKYILPDNFGKEVSCTDSTNSSQIGKMNISELYSVYGNISGSGLVERYAILNDKVKAQPSSASKLSLVSSSASDTTQIVQIRGIVSGSETYETITLTGTTPVQTTNTYSSVTAISKSAETTGVVTITSNSGAVTIAVMGGSMLVTDYSIILLHYIPTEVITISLPYIINPLPLSRDYDYPVIDIGDLLEVGSLADCWRYKRQFSKANTMDLLFTQQLQEYIWSQENQPNEIKQFVPQMYSRDTV